MQPFISCKTCTAPVYRRDIIREKDIRTAPGHLVILFKCPNCRNADRLVATREEWLGFVSVEENDEDAIDRSVQAFAEDLRVLVSTPQDLYNIWASHGTAPPVEVMKSCDCSTCKGKRNVPRT